MMFNWLSITQLEFADGTCIVFTAPAFTLILSKIFLKEDIHLSGFIACFGSAIGVLLIARPSFLFGSSSSLPQQNNGTVITEDTLTVDNAIFSRPVTISLGIFGAILSAVANMYVRLLKTVNPIIVVYYLMLMCIVLPLFFSPMQAPVWPESFDIILALIWIGISGFIGQAFKTLGLSMESAGKASMMRQLDLVMAIIFQATIFTNEPITISSLMGCILILTAAITLGFGKIYNF